MFEAHFSYGFRCCCRQHLLCFFGVLSKLEGPRQASTFDPVDQPLAYQLLQGLLDVRALFEEIITVGGTDVGEDGVDGGSFARSHLHDGSEEHDPHSCHKNKAQSVNGAAAVKAAVSDRTRRNILGNDIFVFGWASILWTTFFLSSGGGGTK